MAFLLLFSICFVFIMGTIDYCEYEESDMESAYKDIQLELAAIKQELHHMGRNINDFSIYMFPQTWPSTALGFPGCGGSAITEAYTYCLLPKDTNDDSAFVFFSGEFAYEAYQTEEFLNDLSKHQMRSVMASGTYNHT